jgi:quinol monooxygenase YgiN
MGWRAHISSDTLHRAEGDPMILARAKIGEFDRFWSVFTTDGAEQRREFGSRGAQVLRNSDDEHEVWVLFDWAGDEFERFLQEPTTRELMAAAGLQGPPEYTVVEQAGQTDS